MCHIPPDMPFNAGEVYISPAGTYTTYCFNHEFKLILMIYQICLDLIWTIYPLFILDNSYLTVKRIMMYNVQLMSYQVYWWFLLCYVFTLLYLKNVFMNY